MDKKLKLPFVEPTPSRAGRWVIINKLTPQYIQATAEALADLLYVAYGNHRKERGIAETDVDDPPRPLEACAHLLVSPDIRDARIEVALAKANLLFPEFVGIGDWGDCGHTVLQVLRLALKESSKDHSSQQFFASLFEAWTESRFKIGVKEFSNVALNYAKLSEHADFDDPMLDEPWQGYAWFFGDAQEVHLQPAINTSLFRRKESPYFWFEFFGINWALKESAELLASEKELDRALRILRIVLRALGMSIQRRDKTMDPEAYRYLQYNESEVLGKILHNFLATFPGWARDPDALSVVMRLARWVTRDTSGGGASPERGDWPAILRTASEHLGRVRPRLKAGDSAPFAYNTFVGSLTIDCIYLLYIRGSVWHAWKALLQCFRVLPEVALPPSLWFLEPVGPFGSVPRLLLRPFHHWVQAEELIDPSLQSLRSSFSQFCLDRLKSEKGEPVEPEWAWRYGYVRAAQELRINPGGDGHHILHWSSTNDPDERVQSAAKAAYHELRKGDTLGDMSPRRSVLHALWWLGQAHMISHNAEVDSSGAQSTRERMVRHTT